MSIGVTVLALLVIVVASWFSLWKLYTIVQRIEKKLDSALQHSDENVGDTDDTSNQ
jgi:hypothetical protein